MSFPEADKTKHIMVQDYIKLLQESYITYNKGYMNKELDIHIVDIFDNFFEDYKDEQILQEFVPDREVLGLVRYNPRFLSYLLYNTTDLWYLILRINGIDHAGELDFKSPVYIIAEGALKYYLNKIYDLKETLLSNGLWV